MRWLPPLVSLLIAPPAFSHAVEFNFLSPQGVGQRTDGGTTWLQWVDGSDPMDQAHLTFFVTRRAWTPWDGLSTFDGGLPRLNFNELRVNEPINALLWDAQAVEPGCYQPFVFIYDEVEREGSLVTAPGRITVAPTDGGNVPPAIVLTNDATQRIGADGNYTVRFSVDDPDDDTRVTLWHVSASSRDAGLIAADLPVPMGRGPRTYDFDTRGLAPGFYSLYAQVTAPDAAHCDAWSSIYLRVLEGVDGGDADAGAGLGDGGAADGGGGGLGEGGTAADAGVGTTPPPAGCGCGAAGSGLLSLLALTLVERLRRSAAHRAV